jgi:hypothetical protein
VSRAASVGATTSNMQQPTRDSAATGRNAMASASRAPAPSPAPRSLLRHTIASNVPICAKMTRIVATLTASKNAPDSAAPNPRATTTTVRKPAMAETPKPTRLKPTARLRRISECPSGDRIAVPVQEWGGQHCHHGPLFTWHRPLPFVIYVDSTLMLEADWVSGHRMPAATLSTGRLPAEATNGATNPVNGRLRIASKVLVSHPDRLTAAVPLRQYVHAIPFAGGGCGGYRCHVLRGSNNLGTYSSAAPRVRDRPTISR